MSKALQALRRPLPAAVSAAGVSSHRRPALWLTVLASLVLWLAILPGLSGAAGTDSSDAQSAYREGKTALRARDYARAVAAFERAAALDPDNPAVFLELGIARSALEDWDGALSAYRQVLSLEPGHPKAHNNIGNVHLRRGDYEKASEYYRSALELKPDYLLAAYHLGWVARQLNRPEEAERVFALCLSLTPQGPRELQTQEDARFYLGALRFRARDYETAASLMERVLSVRRNHLEAHYYLGQSYLRLGRVEEARRHLETHKKLVESRRTTEPVASGGLR